MRLKSTSLFFLLVFSLKSSLIKPDTVVESSKGKIDPCSVDRLRDKCIGGVSSQRRIRYGFINEQQAAGAVAIAYLVVSIWKEWEQETEGDMDGRREKEEEKETAEEKKRWWWTKCPTSQALCLCGGVARSGVSTLYWVTASAEKQGDMALVWQWISPLLFKTASLLSSWNKVHMTFMLLLFMREEAVRFAATLFICFASSPPAMLYQTVSSAFSSHLYHTHTHTHWSIVPWPLADCLKGSICCGRISMDAPSSPPPLSFAKQLAEGEMHVLNN